MISLSLGSISMKTDTTNITTVPAASPPLSCLRDLQETDLTVVVDLDGCLVASDTLWESLLVYLRHNPFNIVRAFLWLFQGKTAFKASLATHVTLDVTGLPYRREVTSLLEDLKRRRRRILLATGAHISVASRIADHLGVFASVLATDNGPAVTGERKRSMVLSELGQCCFAYIGNSSADLPVWRASELAILVDAPESCRKKLWQDQKRILTLLPRQGCPIPTWLKATRVYQWIKNLLVFVPVVLAHRVFQLSPLLASVTAFAAFSLVASAGYLINDLADIESDRHHPTKRGRPLACGEVSIPAALLVIGVLLGSAAALAASLSVSSAGILGIYLAGALTYSCRLKRRLAADTVALALFYTLRIVYGATAAQIEISVWTLAFCVFASLSVALVKRIAELRLAPPESASGSRRGYLCSDVQPLIAQASASAYMALLVLALYVNSPQVQTLYRRPWVLWLLCPSLVYWFNRIIMLANRGDVDIDPILFAFRDKASWLVGMAAGLLFILAI
jgi:4-hydroxybenzoate polyprenyltransferase/soluble P-type ATPase